MNLLRNMIPLDSECIKAAGWSDGRLAVMFPSGRVKFYAEPVTVFQALMSAPSAGKFYNRHIKKLSGCGQSGECVRVAISPDLLSKSCPDYSPTHSGVSSSLSAPEAEDGHSTNKGYYK